MVFWHRLLAARMNVSRLIYQSTDSYLLFGLWFLCESAVLLNAFVCNATLNEGIESDF